MSKIQGHTVLLAVDLLSAEAAMPRSPRWPRWLLLGLIVGAITRIRLKDMEMGWSRGIQIYFFSLMGFILALTLGLGRWLMARPTREQIMARLGLVTNVLTFELDDEGLVYGEQKRSWREFDRFSEDQLAFVLQGNGVLQVIPKRAFALDDLHFVRTLMHENITRR